MINRWWIYQRERFPIFKHGLLIVVFSFSSVCYSALLRGHDSLPSASGVVVAFVTVFIFFLLLRIADEFKDYDDDLRYRPYRAVPRGIVTLRELAVVAAIGAIIQLGLSFWLETKMLLLLVAVWAYLALMYKEFFVGEWLKSRPLIYMVSHMAIMPLIVFYAAACDWFVDDAPTIPYRIGWFLAVSFFSGAVIEIGRKIRAPEDEEEGVDTYSRVWGRSAAAVSWSIVLGLSGAFACLAAREIEFLIPVAAVSALLFVWSALTAYRFVRTPGRALAGHIENTSGLWVLAMYVILGIVPMMLRA